MSRPALHVGARVRDAVLEKRRKADERPSFWSGAAIFLLVLAAIAYEILDAAAWLGGLKAMGWTK